MHTFDCSLFACIRRVRPMSQLQYTVAVNYGTGHTTQSSTVYPLFIHLQYNTTHSRQNLVLNWHMLHLNNKSDLLILKVKSLHQIGPRTEIRLVLLSYWIARSVYFPFLISLCFLSVSFSLSISSCIFLSLAQFFSIYLPFFLHFLSVFLFFCFCIFRIFCV